MSLEIERKSLKSQSINSKSFKIPEKNPLKNLVNEEMIRKNSTTYYSKFLKEKEERLSEMSYLSEETSYKVSLMSPKSIFNINISQILPQKKSPSLLNINSEARLFHVFYFFKYKNRNQDYFNSEAKNVLFQHSAKLKTLLVSFLDSLFQNLFNLPLPIKIILHLLRRTILKQVDLFLKNVRFFFIF